MKTQTRRGGPPDQRGFTLIELMITVAIIAILAAIAYPSYQDSVWKARRGEAKGAITRALQAEERNYTQSNTYLAYATTATTTSAPAGSAFVSFSGDGPTGSRYRIDATATGSGLCSGSTGLTQCVVITATVLGSADPRCGTTMAMDSLGNKAVSSPGTLDLCWGR